MMSSLPSSSFDQGLLNNMDITNTNTKVQAPHAQVQEKHQVSISSSSRSQSQSQSSQSQSQSRSGPNSIPFPWKLHQILDDASTQKFDTIISWVPSHNGFKVHKPKEFDSTIMPKYFHQTKYKSFQRQLNMWGFERVGNGQQKGSYLHPYFIRGKPDLCREMQRTKIKGIHSKKLRKSISNSGSDHSGTGMNSMSSMSSMGMMSTMSMMGSMSSMAMGCMSNMNATRTVSSTGGSGLGSGLASTQVVAASWQAAAQKVAELERQREEIEKKLNVVSRQQNRMKSCGSDHSGTGMNNSTMTPRVSITETMDSSCTSSSSSNSNSNSYSNSNSQQQQDSTYQVQGQLQGLQGLQQVGLQGIISASSLPLEEGDSLFFEGRNFFFVEEGTVKEIGSDGDTAAKKKKQDQQVQSQSRGHQQHRPSRPSRRFSLELKGPDSDEYVLKELEEAIQLGSGIFDNDTTPATSNNNTTTITAATASQYLDTRASYGKISTSTAKRVSSYHSYSQDQEDFFPIPISFPSSSTTSSSNSNNNEPTSINGLFLGLDRPGRRFSLLSTPVYNPFQTKTNISNSNLLSLSSQTKSKSFSTSSSRNNFNNNNNKILKKISTRVSF